MAADPYLDTDTGVLRNRLGIRDAAALAAAEADITALRIDELTRTPIEGAYDLDHLRAFHARIFGDIYAWGGELRTVVISKAQAPFCMPQHLEAMGAAIARELRSQGFLRGLDRPAFLEQLAYFYGEVNALHPFREGNGRAQRAFLGQLAAEAGHPLDWSRLDARGNAVASERAMAGDLGPLVGLLEDVVDKGSNSAAGARRGTPRPAIPVQSRADVGQRVGGAGIG